MTQKAKALPSTQIPGQSLGQEDPLEKWMATHSSILAWKISWTEEPGGLQSMGSQRVGYDWATNTHMCWDWEIGLWEWEVENYRCIFDFCFLDTCACELLCLLSALISSIENFFLFVLAFGVKGFPGGSDGQRFCQQCKRPEFDPWVGRIPWRREWQPTPVFLPGEFHGHRSLVGYSPWGHKDWHDWVTFTHSNNLLISEIFCQTPLGRHPWPQT